MFFNKQKKEKIVSITIDFGIDFGDDGKKLIPVAMQEQKTLKMLFIAFTNQVAYQRTVTTRSLWLFSRTNNALWEKGATSGCTFTVKKIFLNCNRDSLLYMVAKNPHSTKGVCHNRNTEGEYYSTCFYTKIS